MIYPSVHAGIVIGVTDRFDRGSSFGVRVNPISVSFHEVSGVVRRWGLEDPSDLGRLKGFVVNCPCVGR